MNLTKAFSGGGHSSTFGMLRPWESQEGAHTPSGSKTPIMICGWLYKMKRKKRKFRSTWNRRWFTVEDGALHWYKTSSSNACGRLSLMDIQSARKFDSGNVGDVGRGNFAFVVRGTSCDMLLRADSANDESRWIRGLTLQIDLVRGGTFQGPPSNKNRRRGVAESRFATAGRGTIAATAEGSRRSHSLEMNNRVRAIVEDQGNGQPTGQTEDGTVSSDSFPQSWKGNDGTPPEHSSKSRASLLPAVKMIPRVPRGISNSCRRRRVSSSSSSKLKVHGETGSDGCGGTCGEVDGGDEGRRGRRSGRVVPVSDSPKSRPDDASSNAETQDGSHCDGDDAPWSNGISDSGKDACCDAMGSCGNEEVWKQQQRQHEPPLTRAFAPINAKGSQAESSRRASGASHARGDVFDPGSQSDIEGEKYYDSKEYDCREQPLESRGMRRLWQVGRPPSVADGGRNRSSSRPRRRDEGEGLNSGRTGSGKAVRLATETCSRAEGFKPPKRGGGGDGDGYVRKTRHEHKQPFDDVGDAFSSDRSADTMENSFMEHELFSIDTPRLLNVHSGSDVAVGADGHRQQRCAGLAAPTSCTPPSSSLNGKINFDDDEDGESSPGEHSVENANLWLRAGSGASSAPRESRDSTTAEESWSAGLAKDCLENETPPTSKLGSSGRSSSLSGYRRPSRRYLVQQRQNRQGL